MRRRRPAAARTAGLAALVAMGLAALAAPFGSASTSAAAVPPATTAVVFGGPPPTDPSTPDVPTTDLDDEPGAGRGIGLVVEAGVRGFSDPGDHIVVTALVSSEETIEGRIDVILPSTDSTISRDVQVAGGTTKQVLLVVPTGFDTTTAFPVRLSVGGEVVREKSITLKTSVTVELVGILPALATRLGDIPEQVELTDDLGRAQLQPIDDEVFTLGPAALDAYDTIVGVGGDLATLDGTGRASLLAWMNQGGRLLLDDRAGQDVLPAEWRPGPAGYAWAGRGEVRFVDGAASAGRFGEIVEPSTSSRNEQPGGFFGGTDGGGSIEGDLALRAGVTLPSLTPILIGLLAYVLVIGPLLYIGLRMWRRLTLGWVLVPAIAVLTGAVVLVAAGGFRDSGRPATTTFVDGFPGGSEESLAVLTFTRSGGTSRVAFPAGWQLSTSIEDFSNVNIGHRFSAAADSSNFRAQLEPGQVTDAMFVGLGGAVGLSVEATARDGAIIGTVTNDTPQDLYDVAVFANGDARLIGMLAAGASQPFELDDTPQPQNFGLSQTVWSRPDQGLGNGNRESDKAEFAIWRLASERIALYPTGMVRAAGWTDDRPNQGNLGTAASTRAVVTTTAPITAGDGPLSSAAVRTVQVRPPFDQFGAGSGDSAIRYLVAPDTAAQTLVVEAAFGMTALDFWNGTTWRTVPIEGRLAVVPPDSIRNGVVLMRIEVDPNFSFDPNQVLLMRGATDGDALS